MSFVVVAILLCVAIVIMQMIHFRGTGMRGGPVALGAVVLLAGTILLSIVYRLGSLALRRARAKPETLRGLSTDDFLLEKEYKAPGPALLDFEEVYWLGDRCIMVYCGDITELTAEALASSDDNYLSMGGGVSARIRAVGGDTIRDEAQRQRPAKIGDVIVTTAGRLGGRYVFHAVVIDLDQRMGPSLEAISTTSRHVFERADALDVTSIAVPALGGESRQFRAGTNRSVRSPQGPAFRVSPIPPTPRSSETSYGPRWDPEGRGITPAARSRSCGRGSAT